jgi:serine/threonine protein kinase
VSSEQSYLSRALGIQSNLDIDYQALRLEPGDVFVIVTDGVHEFASARFMINAVKDHGADLDAAARAISNEAFERGSKDNLTTVIVRVEQIPEQSANEVHRQLTELPFPPDLVPRMSFDGFTILRELHASPRSHVYLASLDPAEPPVVIKTLSTEMRNDDANLERFLMEDWVAQRISNAHVVKAAARGHRRKFLYTVTEFIDGQTLHQWLIDHPRPPVETVRGLVEQIARGLTAFHRLEMLHQDLRPHNVMIDARGTAKLIDFGSTRVAGISEIDSPIGRSELLGTLQYTAPEYFLGESGTTRSDLFSLAVVTYQMLSGRLPFDAEVPKARTRAAQRQLKYRSVLDDEREIPAWIDDVLRKATHPDPNRRYEELSEFVHDLRHPTEDYLSRKRPPLLERNPVAFWRGVSLILAAVVVLLLLL